MPSRVTLNSNAMAVKAEMTANLSSAIGAMARAIRTNSRMVAPKKDNHLRSSVAIEGTGMFREISYGSPSVRYAAYQERGMRADGTHVVRRYTTAGTHAHFLEQAADAAVKQGIGVYLK